ncbi:MAG: 3-phosphoshikimate 1-carboxyvinyltransferase [Calditrichia bacterium]
MTSQTIDCGKLDGRLSVPASKSLTHRYFIQAALSGNPVTIYKPLKSEDAHITLTALQKMGYDAADYDDHVVFSGKRIPVSSCSFWVENSGTSARLLSGVMALQSFPCEMDGSARMRERPMQTLIDALQKLGATVEHHNGYLPLKTSGGNLSGRLLEVDASKSSQFLSSILLIAPYLDGELKLLYGENLASASYLTMTVELMKRAGVEVSEISGGFIVKGGSGYSIADTTVEGDFSSASYFLTGAALSGGKVSISNVTADSLQGDAVITEVLRQAGAEVQWHDSGVTVTGTGRIHAVDVDVRSVPDLAPTIAVLALFADGMSRLRHVDHLRYKECDRLAAVIENISRLGGKAYAEDNQLIIEPRPLKGALLASYNDHRMAMCFALAGLRVPGVVIENRECVIKSYPGYWEDFHHLHQAKT